MSIPSDRQSLPMTGSHQQIETEIESRNPSFPPRSSLTQVARSNINTEPEGMKNVNTHSATVPNVTNGLKPELAPSRNETAYFLSQLSEVASNRLEAGKVSESVSSKAMKSYAVDSNTLTARQSQKRRDLVEDMFGSCLHSNTGFSSVKDNEITSKTQVKKRVRSYLRKGKWTVSNSCICHYIDLCIFVKLTTISL